MSNKTRKIIFLSCFFLFIIITPLTILYSQGYRIDFEDRKIKQTGGIFLKIIPKRVDIYINEILEKRTDFFFGSALIENLLPKKYKIEIKKQGYHTWEKTLEIKEKEVTEARNVILFPENINFNVLSYQIENFWLCPDKTNLILLEKESPLSNASWSLKIYYLDREIKSHLIDEIDISPQGAKLIDLAFLHHTKKIYLKSEVNQEIKYFILDLGPIKPVLSEKEFLEEEIKDLIAYKLVAQELYYLDNQGYLFRSKIKNNSKIYSDFFPFKEDMLVDEEKLSQKAFSLEDEKEYSLAVFNDFIFLQEEKNLYKFNSDLKIFEKFFENINFLEISPDNKKIAYYSNHEIWLLFLSDEGVPLHKEKGEKFLLTRLSDIISNINWINENYLIFLAGQKIKISEIDNRDRINLIDIFEIKELPQNGNSIKILFNNFDKKIYLLDKEKLYASDPLFP